MNKDTGNLSGSPFHHGEQSVQERLGVRDIEDWARKVVHDHLPEQHQEFHTSQPFLVVSARDDAGHPWATLLAGPEGFVTSPDPRRLVIHAKPMIGDALENAFVEDADMGILGIELATRRRNRVNGRVASNGSNTITFRVDQAFGNCPQYIREREWKRVDSEPSATVQRSTGLSSTQQEWIEAADTFFIASTHSETGMDATHRGGMPGFVEVVSNSILRFPDYAGNNMFNTLGNITNNPRTGLLFIDFETGKTLKLSGRAEILWSESEKKFGVYLVPQSLLGAIWAQFAEIQDQRKVIGSCEVCGTWFERIRKDKRHCSDRCRVRAMRLRKEGKK